ncbi:MAG: GNAT family N-acetyltransferase [Chitinivibrionia bacterium]|nr:GNAT family N-acetyltransferase [Chitinivibrionia bacterium]
MKVKNSKLFLDVAAERFPKEIRDGDILLLRISLLNDENILKELLAIHKNNKEHFSYWHQGLKELLFATTNDIKKYIKKTHSICYAVYYLDKAIGHIEISKSFSPLPPKLEEKNKVDITYLIDKNYAQKGIMYKCLILLENMISAQGFNLLKNYVDKRNTPSVNLMKKLGYEILGIGGIISEEMETTVVTYYEFQKTLNTDIENKD